MKSKKVTTLINSIDNQFDDQFKKIQSLNWLPWVGKNYTKQPAGKKLLIVGESHYVPLGEDPDDVYSHMDWTRKFVSKEGLKLTSLYTGNAINPLVCNTERAIFNEKCPTDENKKNLWYSVAFYNLIQRLLTSINTEDRPTEKDFLTGWEVFLKVIDILNPNICLVLGKAGFGLLGHYLKNNPTDWSIRVEIHGQEKIAFLSKNEREIKLIFIRHPSQYFSWTKWAEIINQQVFENNNWYSK